MSHRATRRGFLGLAGKAAAVAAAAAALPALDIGTAAATRPGGSSGAACTEPANAGVQCSQRRVKV